MILNEIMKISIFQDNSNLLLIWTFSLTPKEAMVDDLAKACVTEKIIVLFIENPDLVSNIYITQFCFFLIGISNVAELMIFFQSSWLLVSEKLANMIISNISVYFSIFDSVAVKLLKERDYFWCHKCTFQSPLNIRNCILTQLTSSPS